jgi:serine/threonine-protein kinase
MSGTASDVRRSPGAPAYGEGAGLFGAPPISSAVRAERATLDSPTIITGRQPMPAPAMSDAMARILDGRIVPGDRLGHFDLVEFVGGGGMGRVFRAIDTRLGRTVALKVLPPDQALDADSLQRFQNEAQSSARLDHDNIARAYFLGEDQGLHFIVFEFVEGVNVRVLVERKGPLPLEVAVSYTLQVAEALAHADARAVVHRDIKPSNVLITPEERVKLIDMGLARLRHADPAVADLTASGVTLGTFDYISPEQARDPRNADIRSDIYSLGCTLFFMLAGHPPFPEGTVLQKLLQHQGDQPPDIQEARPDLPDEAGRILRKMMAKDPRHRYAGPAELMADLMLLAEQIGLRAMSPTSRIWSVPQAPSVSLLQRHWPWMAPVVTLICIVVLLDRYWSSPTPRDVQTPSAAERPAGLPTSPTVLPSEGARAIRRRDGLDTERSAAGKPRSSSAVTKSVSSTKPLPKPSQPSREKPPEEIIAPVAGQEAGRPADRGALAREKAKGLASAVGQGKLPLGESAVFSGTAEGKASPQETATLRSGLLIVREAPEGKEQFATLTAACAAAHNGDVIELQFNGSREDRPLRISNQRITIRSGEGYQPTIVFRPTDIDPVKYPRSMFSLAGGQLTLLNVAIELYVPRGVPADNWSLVETRGGELVRLSHCLLTVRNASDKGDAYHPDVAFFRARSAPEMEAALVALPTATPLATLELNDCIARGEADFLRVEDLQPIHLTWDNGLLLCSDRLLVAGGSQTAPRLDDMLRIELRHVTAVTRGGLCRLSSTSANPYQLTVQVGVTNCIIRTSPGVSLITQEGAAGVESFRQRLLWNGQRNFYEDVNPFWTVRSTLEPDALPSIMDFDAWLAYWGPSREDEASTERLMWKRVPDADQPLHAQGPSYYTLEDPTFGDASAGAPGCRADRLPAVPFNSSSSSHTIW